MGLINKKAVKEFIKGNSASITQIECTFYSGLEAEVMKMIRRAIAANASRRRITGYELLANGNSVKRLPEESEQR